MLKVFLPVIMLVFATMLTSCSEHSSGRKKKAAAPSTQHITLGKKILAANSTFRERLHVVNMDVIPIMYVVATSGNSSKGATLYRLDLYYTRDNGKHWIYYGQDKDLKPPINFTVSSGDGLYGFYTFAIDEMSCRRRGPESGTRPHVSVIVDTKKPTLSIIAPKAGDIYNFDAPILIKWVVTDENLEHKGISIDFSVDNGASWRSIAKDLMNTGEYKWTPQKKPIPTCQIRVIAIDRAKNNITKVSENFLLNTATTLPKINNATGQ